MTNEDSIESSSKPWAAILAAIVSLAGIADAAYLTIHHYTAEPVPCSVFEGCEQVLNSQWATIGGVPLAIFGLLAYFTAFSLALLTIFGNRMMWKFFGHRSLSWPASPPGSSTSKPLSSAHSANSACFQL
ncbi:MAG: vitamin K epoxide reductase family protein [Acidobacteria bacterium]|nr:vitamin K epoxide reductase family protein [Acidobacteriota bacterium]